MTTQYTPILKLALPVTGELSGTWGDTVNDNITSMVEQAVAGLATISTWTGNSKTLTVANGTTSESRCAMLVAQTGSGGSALTGAGEIVCPASSKLYVLKNDSSFAITLKTAAGTGVAVAAGNTAFLFCDGTNVNACVTTIIDGRVTGNLTVDGNATINGNTTLGNATSDTITATARFASGLTPSADNTYDLGSSGNSWKDVYIDGTAYLALVDINGGTIDGVSIGASTAATIINVDNLRLDGNTLSSTDTNGNVVIAPNGTGDVQLDADTVRVGDSGAAATLTSNGAGALTVTTGGAANLVLSTNSGTDSGTITIANGANGNITLAPNGSGIAILSTDVVRVGDLNTDAAITTNGTGNLNLTTNSGTNSGVIQIAQGANGNITLTPNGTGSVSVPKLVWSTGTATRVPYLTTGGLFTDSANMTFNGTRLTVADLADSGLTSGRVTYASTGGALVDSANLTFDGTTLTANALTVTNAVTLNGGTTNGVAYLNGSKVLTTGSALTFDGTNLSSTGGATFQGGPTGYGGGEVRLGTTASGQQSAISTLSVDSPVLVFDHRGTSNTGVFVWRNGTGGANELARLTSTGLGIGTSSPGQKLDVQASGYPIINVASTSGSGANGAILRAVNGGGAQSFFGTETTSGSYSYTGGIANAAYVGSGGANPLQFITNSVARATLDSSGNLGLGVTPSAWTLGPAFEQSAGSLWSAGTNQIQVMQNCYYNGSYRYKTTSAATYYGQGSAGAGVHAWYTAPSGTAGNVISFTQAMTLDASGNLQVKPGNIFTDATSGIFFTGTIGNFANGIYGVGTNNVAISAGGSERARIDSSGNLLVGKTSGSSRLDVAAAFTGTQSVARFGNTTASGNVACLDTSLESNGNSTSSYHLRSVTQNVNIWYLYGNGTSSFTSDRRLKKNIATARDGYLDDLMQLRVVKYHWKNNDDAAPKELGLIAQEVEQVFPGLVQEADLEFDGVTPKVLKGSVLTFMLLKAIQEQQAIITALTARVAALESN